MKRNKSVIVITKSAAGEKKLIDRRTNEAAAFLQIRSEQFHQPETDLRLVAQETKKIFAFDKFKDARRNRFQLYFKRQTVERFDHSENFIRLDGANNTRFGIKTQMSLPFDQNMNPARLVACRKDFDFFPESLDLFDSG